MEKPKGQIEKEEKYLSHVKLCEHNIRGHCHPPGGRRCNFAHCLAELRPPNEADGVWSRAWYEGDVDIRFWAEYKVNLASRHRFRQQFLWERANRPNAIPNWAWGHAVSLGFQNPEELPVHVPKDYSWPEMQKLWREAKQRGRDTSRCMPNWGRPPPKAPPPQHQHAPGSSTDVPAPKAANQPPPRAVPAQVQHGAGPNTGGEADQPLPKAGPVPEAAPAQEEDGAGPNAGGQPLPKAVPAQEEPEFVDLLGLYVPFLEPEVPDPTTASAAVDPKVASKAVPKRTKPEKGNKMFFPPPGPPAGDPPPGIREPPAPPGGSPSPKMGHL